MPISPLRTSSRGWANFDDLGMLQQLGVIPLIG